MGRDKHALITGLFLIVFIVAVTAAIYWIGHFERERNVYVVETLKSVSGLNPESTVFYRGIAVGKVINIVFDPKDTGIILVPIEVDKNIIFKKGVFATLRLKGVTGMTQIQLEDSGDSVAVLVPGDDPSSRIPLMPSMTDRLMDSGEALLQKADTVMSRVGSLLNVENEKNLGEFLAKLNTLTGKLPDLQISFEKALAGVPALTTDSQKTLAHINALTHDLQVLTGDIKTLSLNADNMFKKGETASDQLMQTTLPKVNKMLTELQSTAQQIKRAATMLDNNPQALLLGPDHHDSGPGEPGYKEPK